MEYTCSQDKVMISLEDGVAKERCNSLKMEELSFGCLKIILINRKLGRQGIGKI